MASVTYTITFNSGTNSDKGNGGTLGATIKKNGTVPTGAYVTSASQYISALKVYSSKGPYLQIGSYGSSGTLSQNSSDHSTTVSASINDSIFNVSSESITITVRMSGTTNALNIRAGCTMTLTVNYNQSFTKSTASLNPTSIAAGASTTVTISNSKLSEQNHKLTWKFGTYSSTQSVGTGVGSTSFQISTTWMNAIPSSVSGTGSVTVETYAGSTLIGSNSYSFTVTVPASIVPTIGSVTATRIDNTVPAGWGIYVQNKSGVKITANSCSGAYSSTIVSYVYSGGASASSTSNTYTLSPITQSGTISFTVTIKDSRGRTASKSASITVYQYSAPSFTASVAYRCTSAGESNENGTYIGARSNYNLSTCNGKNTATLQAFYARSDSSSWTNGATQTPNVASVFGGGTINVNYTYRVLFRVTDAFGYVDKVVDVNTSLYTIFFKRGGQGVAFGKVAERECAVEISPEWGLYHGSVDLIAKINELESRLAKLGG